MSKHAAVLRRLVPLVVLVCLALAGGVRVPVALAQEDDDRSVEVDRRDATVTILANGDVRIVETWETQFYGGPFRFAFREIPLNRVENIVDWGVSENGQPYTVSDSEAPSTYSLEQSSREHKITWYFPETTDQTRTFTLSYTLRGALRIYPEGDQFFWTFIEADRQYSIHASSVTVLLPRQFVPDQLLVANYKNQRELPEGAQIVDGETVRFEGQAFSSGDEWEIRVQFPHGVVPDRVPAWQPADDAARARDEALLARRPFFNLLSLGAALIILIGGGLGLYLWWYTKGRRTTPGTSAPYATTPPDDVPPGVIGTLLDERVDMQDIVATLVDLARRGYLRIEEKGKRKRNARPDDFVFVRGNGDVRALRPFEAYLLDRIFGSARATRSLSTMKNQFYEAIPPLSELLYQETIERGYFARKPDVTRNRYTALGGAIGGLLFALSCGTWIVVARYAPLLILVAVVIGVLSVIYLIMSRLVSCKTRVGATAAAKWQGFKRYLENLDRYTEVEQAQDQFERYLPYAIAFGLEQQWVGHFKQAQIPAPRWYQPHGNDPVSSREPNHGSRTQQSSSPRSGAGSGSGGGASWGHSGGGGASWGDSSGGGVSWGDSGGGGAPWGERRGTRLSSNTAAGQSFGSLGSMSAGLLNMLSSTSSTFTSQPPRPSSSSSSSLGGFSGGGSSGGGGGGGGSSGFG